MTKVNNATAEHLLGSSKNFRDVVLVSLAGDWLLMSRAEHETFLNPGKCNFKQGKSQLKGDD